MFGLGLSSSHYVFKFALWCNVYLVHMHCTWLRTVHVHVPSVNERDAFHCVFCKGWVRSIPVYFYLYLSDYTGFRLQICRSSSSKVVVNNDCLNSKTIFGAKRWKVTFYAMVCPLQTCKKKKCHRRIDRKLTCDSLHISNDTSYVALRRTTPFESTFSLSKHLPAWMICPDPIPQLEWESE